MTACSVCACRVEQWPNHSWILLRNITSNTIFQIWISEYTYQQYWPIIVEAYIFCKVAAAKSQLECKKRTEVNR